MAAAPVTSFINFLNTHTHKEAIKTGSGYFSITAAPFAAYDLLYGNARTLSAISADISLILKGAISRPGVVAISAIVHQFLTSESLAKVFGPNTIFAVNPYHPRHVVSIIALVLMAPAVASEAHSLYRKITCQPSIQQGPQQPGWMRALVVISFLSDRVLLHVANQQLAKLF